MKVIFIFLLSISWAYGQQADTLVGAVQKNGKIIEIQKPKNQADLDARKYITEEVTKNIFAFLAGFSFLMMIFLFFKSVVNDWDKANLYCSLMFLFVFLNMICWIVDFMSNNVYLYAIAMWFNVMTPIMMTILYREILNLKADWYLFYKYTTIVIWLLFILSIISFFTYILQYLWWWNVSSLIFNYVLLAYTILFFPFTFARYHRHPIYRYAVWSNIVVTVFYLIFMITGVMELYDPFPYWFSPVNLLGIATMIDGILFLFALTQRDRLILREKMLLQQQVIANELKALHSQMNPHFIFNALNSIKSFTLNNDSASANYYLTKFSKLIRQVLENSRSEKISLKNELETLALYLDIEKLRVGNKFDYQINADEEVETEFLEIPPMLIQPYIENAIWHGLMPKEEKGNVNIYVKQFENYITITIEDNGIGRAKASLLKSMNGSNHKSFGMKITTERLDILRQLHNVESKVTIEDLKNIDSTAAGTKVILEIPI